MFTHEQLSGFNELELSIYNCILKNKDSLSRMKIKDLADEAHVSTGTVLRFCKKIGCTGYSEFKLRFKESLDVGEAPLGDPEEVTFRNFLSYTATSLFQESLDKAFRMLKESERIIFIGIGSSGILGKYGARFFSNIGRFSFYVEDTFLPILQELRSDTVTIALSVSGTTKETLFLADQVKKRGSQLISITSNPNSTLAKISDCTIPYQVPTLNIDENVNITTQVPVIYIIETLTRKLYTA